jgi:hypothetical protein
MTAASQTLPACVAFEDGRLIAQGSPAEVAVAVKKRLAKRDHGHVLMFDHASGKVLDLNLHGSDKEITARYERHAELEREAPEAPRGPGRPKLGVVAREVTLLPRHWEWLNAQPGGASVALRRLVDEARKAAGGRDRKRAAQEAAYRFLSAIAGNYPDYEEALRALFAGDGAKFDTLTKGWPPDAREHARRLASPAFGAVKTGGD